MLYKMGDIIVVKGTIFKEDGLYDTHIYGRPVLILDSTDKMFYYLLMSTKRLIIDPEKQYYHIKGTSYRKSYINCKSIYRKKLEIHNIRDTLSDTQLDRVLEQFIHYQECALEDEFYNEIKENVKKYVVQRRGIK